jgi:para-aminobenzoate synthetase
VRTLGSVDAGMRTLLIDNYDSFTFNLFHLLGEVNGDEPIVARNDELTWEELAARVENIVISPGPGHPRRERDVGISLDALVSADVHVLGVCLGHQALAHIAGGAISHAPELKHGRTSPINHDRRGRSRASRRASRPCANTRWSSAWCPLPCA